jgi:hypothetical protein
MDFVADPKGQLGTLRVNRIKIEIAYNLINPLNIYR